MLLLRQGGVLAHTHSGLSFYPIDQHERLRRRLQHILPSLSVNLMSSAMAEFPLCGARLEVSLLGNLTLSLIHKKYKQMSRDINTGEYENSATVESEGIGRVILKGHQWLLNVSIC